LSSRKRNGRGGERAKEGRERERESRSREMENRLGLWLCIALAIASSASALNRNLLVSCPDDDCVIKDVLSSYPYIVSLEIDWDPAENAELCTGTLVSEAGWILTAAHCIFNPELGGVWDDASVRAALAPDSREEDAQVVNIPYEDIFVHPNFMKREEGEDGQSNDDIALLRFDPALVDWEDLKVVSLAAGTSEPEDYSGERVQAMGYGSTGNPDLEKDDQDFRTITLRVTPCPEDLAERQTDVICTEDQYAGDVCAGDSGGPLLYPIINDGQPDFMQIGIVSQGYRSSQCIDRFSDPTAVGEDGDGIGTWNFIPYQAEWLCEVGGPGVGLCDNDSDGPPSEDYEPDDDNDSEDDDDNDSEGDDSGDK